MPFSRIKPTSSALAGHFFTTSATWEACINSSCGVCASPDGASGKEPTCQCRRRKRFGYDPRVRKIPWRRQWQPTPVFLPEKSHGQRCLAGYRPWGFKESDMIEHTHTHGILTWIIQVQNKISKVLLCLNKPSIFTTAEDQRHYASNADMERD